MEEHVALAKANLVQAEAQYEAAQILYSSALELQKTGQPCEAQSEATKRIRSRAEFSIHDTLINLTSDVNDAENIEPPPPTFCESCRTSLLVTCFTENTWLSSKRKVLCDLSEAARKGYGCTLCQFLVDTSRLMQRSRLSATSTPSTDSIVNHQVRIVQGSSKYSWPKIAGCVLDVPVSPFAWLELGSHPRIGVEEAPYICVALDPNEDTRPSQAPREISGPRVRSMYEQSTGLVDYNLINSWIDICTTFHGPKREGLCHVENEGSSTMPMYLINLKTRKIATAQVGTRYVAVSYVWGDDASQTSSNSVVPPYHDGERLVTPHTDRGLQLPKRLPQTLEDALTLTEAIGEQFVWIDKYCIDQNNVRQVEEQVANMDTIYRQAWLTVIALVSDDVNSGIAGVSRPMQSRMQPTLALPEGKLIATHVEFTREHSGRLPWDQRAWTLQEFVLSRRCLIFSSYHVSMKCQEEFFHDILPVNTSVTRTQTKLDGENWWENVYAIDLNGNVWDFKAFDGLISIYSGRHLRYQSDILRACQGTLNQITQKTGMVFTFGMPVKDLHRALLWKAHNAVCLERRKWYDEHSQSWKSFPSWTWAGWQGRTECDYWIGDMAGYMDQDPGDGIKILNRKGRKRPRMDDSALDARSNPHQAQIISYPTMDEVDRPSLRIFSSVAACHVKCIRKHDTPYQTSKNGAKREFTSIGDHWTLLEPDTGHKMRDIAGNEEVFERRDYFFRTAASTSKKLVQEGCEAELLMISHWPLIRDSETSSTWLKDMVSCLVILRNDDGTPWRIAAILLEEEAWKRFDSALAEVHVV